MANRLPGKVRSLIAEARRLGWAGNEYEFKSFLIKVHLETFPQWSADDLSDRPRQAMRYCDEVVKRAGMEPCEESEAVILKTRRRIRKDKEEAQYGWPGTQGECSGDGLYDEG